MIYYEVREPMFENIEKSILKNIIFANSKKEPYFSNFYSLILEKTSKETGLSMAEIEYILIDFYWLENKDKSVRIGRFDHYGSK